MRIGLQKTEHRNKRLSTTDSVKKQKRPLVLKID